MDHNGRVFVHSESDDVSLVLNEGGNARTFLRKIIALCTEHLMMMDQIHGTEDAGTAE